MSGWLPTTLQNPAAGEKERERTHIFSNYKTSTSKGFLLKPLVDLLHVQISGEVSARVQEQVRSLVYGNQLTPGGDAATLPESLLQWLSQRYISSTDLQAALASLEQSLLHNISMRLAQRHNEETVKEAVLHTAGDAGATVTQEVKFEKQK